MFQIRNIAKLVRSSPQRYEVFKAAVKRLDETRQRRAAEEKKEYQPRVKGLILDVVTRWHSMMMMMERGLEFKDVSSPIHSGSQVAYILLRSGYRRPLQKRRSSLLCAVSPVER